MQKNTNNIEDTSNSVYTYVDNLEKLKQEYAKYSNLTIPEAATKMGLSASKTDLPCFNPSCGSSDAVALYESPAPHSHCFSCGDQSYDKEKIKEYTNMSTLASEKNTITTPFPAKGTFLELTNRKIGRDAAKKYGVVTITNDDGTLKARAFPFPNEQGTMTAQKLKSIDNSGTKKKRMKWIGDHRGITLFGQNLFSGGGRYITITEGEEDALAAYEMLTERSFPIGAAVVSIPNGAQNAVSACKNSWSYLNSFNEIILSFDSDEPGRKAAQEVANLFPGKVKIIKLDEGMDANEYLKNNRLADYVSSWFSAEKYAPQGVIPFSNMWDAMTEESLSTSVSWPWEGMNDLLIHMETGRLIVWKAPPKVGKTAVIREVAYHVLMNSEHNVGFISLEETKKGIALGFCGLHLDKPLGRPDATIDIEELKEAHKELSEEDRLIIYDPAAEHSAASVIDKIIYFVKVHGCKYIFLDHIMMLAYSSENDYERKFLDKLCSDLKGLTTQLDICLHIVTHVNDEGKTRGSRAPVQLCDALISLDRDKMNPDTKIANTTALVVEENRLTGESGIACKLFFNKETGRLEELQGGMDVTPPTPRTDLTFDED